MRAARRGTQRVGLIHPEPPMGIFCRIVWHRVNLISLGTGTSRHLSAHKGLSCRVFMGRSGSLYWGGS